MKKRDRNKKKKAPPRLNVTAEQIEEFVQRAQQVLPQKDYELLFAISESLIFMRNAYDQKRISERNLLRMIFGPHSERTAVILGQTTGKYQKDKSEKQKQKPKGHGRNGSDDYPGAQRIRVPHTTMKPGEQCPECCRGKVYREREPKILIRFVAKVPVDATVYEAEQLRCNACGQIFDAPLPAEAAKPKYDETVGAMIAVLRYGSGLPMNRIEVLQESFGIPFPASTQWEIIDRMADVISPAYEEMIRQGACGQIMHNDDTGMKILALCKLRQQQKPEEEEEDPEDGIDHKSSRNGTFTSGFVCETDGRRIALFFTGEHHAGENMADLLQKRKQELDPPIQMCDGLKRNLPKSFHVLLSNCLAHGRRHFVDVIEDFPEECRLVIENLALVFANEEIALEQNMTPAQRLLFHQSESKPVMDKLKEWLQEQFDQKKVEPNSGLGRAINYMLKRWKPLTLFLEVEGAPLHNNICERALKKAILHRKNSLFFKTFHGAYVGDALMSLIHTCNLAKSNPFDYLVALQLHRHQLKSNPELWMPWNYRSTTDETARASPAN
jgi:transposase